MSAVPVKVDLYEVLGVARSASAPDLRRAYRRLALAHHPDRAGAASTARFAAIADAYRVLSDPLARSAYDASLVDHATWRRREDGGPVHSGGVGWNVSTNGWRVTRPAAVRDPLPRVSGKLEDLVSAGVATSRPDGSIELVLLGEEARAGGTAVIELRVKVVCASCGGVARPRGVWCRVCDYEGAVFEVATALVAVPAGARRGDVVEVRVPRSNASLRIHLQTTA